jgi:uncharacterized protein with PIN domain
VRSVGESRLVVSSKPTFLADAMLGSVARKLRIFGFDTLYLKHIDDDDVLKIGITQNRIILTCDKELFKRIVKVGAFGMLLEGSSESENLVNTLCKYGISSITFDSVNSRCSDCNGLLSKQKPDDINKYVNPDITKRHKEFFQCENCYKIYWEGSHVTRIRSLGRNLDSKIKAKLAEM